MKDMYESKVLRQVATNFKADMPDLGSIDFWGAFKHMLGAKMRQATFDRPGGAMKMDDFDKWVDGTMKDTEELNSCPGDLDFLLAEAASKMAETIRDENEKALFLELTEIRNDDADEFKKIIEKPGVVKMRRIDRYVRNTQMAVSTRLKKAYQEQAYHIGGSVPISTYIGKFSKLARAYYGSAFASNQGAIVQDMVKSIYGVGLDANKVTQAIKTACDLKAEAVTFREAVVYLRELLANTEKRQSVAMKGVDEPSTNKRPYQTKGYKSKKQKTTEAGKSAGKCKRCNEEHKNGKCPKIECFNCGKLGHIKRDCRSKKAKVQTKKDEPAEQVNVAIDDDNSIDEIAAFCANTMDGENTTKELAVWDSGANTNVVGDKDLLTGYRALDEPRILATAGINDGEILGYGTMEINLKANDGTWVPILLNKVAYVRGARQMVIAANPMYRSGQFTIDPLARHVVHAPTGKQVDLIDERGISEVELVVPEDGPIVKVGFDMNPKDNHVKASPGAVRYFSFLHDTFGHIGFQLLSRTLKACGIDFAVSREMQAPCNSCIVATQTSRYRPTNRPRKEQATTNQSIEGANSSSATNSTGSNLIPGHHWSMDWFEMPTSAGKNQGMFSLLDHCTGYFQAEPADSKAGRNLGDVLETLLTDWQHIPGVIVLGPRILADCATEWRGSYNSTGILNAEDRAKARDEKYDSKLGAVCRTYRIKLSFANPGHSFENLIESHHRWVRSFIRTNCISSGTPLNRWDEMWAKWGNLTYNMRPARNNPEITRWQAFHGIRFPVQKLRPLGCSAQLLKRPVGYTRTTDEKANLNQGEDAIFSGYRLSWSRAGGVNVLWLFRKDKDTDFHVASRDVKWFPFERPLLKGAHVNEVKRMGAIADWLEPIEAAKPPKKRGRPRKYPQDDGDAASKKQQRQTQDKEERRRSPRLREEEAAVLALFDEKNLEDYYEYQRPMIRLYDVRETALLAKVEEALDQITWNVTPEMMEKKWFGPVKLRPNESLREGYKTPSQLKKALACPEYGKYWRASYFEEYKAMLDNKTWRRVGGQELLELRKRLGKPLPVTVVLKAKTSELPIRFKSRFCVMGNYQDKSTIGLTYAPTVHEGSVPMLLTFALTYDLEVKTLDAKGAFLRGDLQQKILVRPPPGVDLGGDLLLLERNLYGLAVAARTWWKLLCHLLLRWGMVQCTYDKSVWYHPKKKLFCCVHVDDILMVGPTGSANKLAAFLRKSPEKVETTVEELSVYLGKEYKLVENKDGNKYYEVTVARKIEELETKFEGIPVNPDMPCPSSDEWMAQPSTDQVAEAKALPFQELIGSLLYISRARPDIKYAVQRLARFTQSWGELQYKVGLRILGYLTRTKNESGLRIFAARNENVSGETDASWADDRHDRRSTLGYTIRLGKTILDCGSRLDKSIALASAESEYRAASLGVRRVLYYRHMLKELGWPINGPSKLWMDNAATIASIRNADQNLTDFAKHIAIAFHNARTEYEAGTIEPDYRSTSELFTDSLTKPLPADEHKHKCATAEGFVLKYNR